MSINYRLYPNVAILPARTYDHKANRPSHMDKSIGPDRLQMNNASLTVPRITKVAQ